MKEHTRILGHRELVNVRAIPVGTMGVERIAHTLSQISRFGGNTTYPYSVAQHAVFVSYLCPKKFAYEGLHHDDEESYTGDFVNPFKSDENRALAGAIRAQLAPVYGLAPEEPEEVKDADMRALTFEQSLLQSDPFAEIAHLDRGQYTHLREIIEAVRQMHPKRAAEAYFERHYELVGGV